MNDNPETIIGRLDWEACEHCVHGDPFEYGCAVPEDKWRAALTVRHGAVHCGAFRRRGNYDPEIGTETTPKGDVDGR